MNLPGLHVPRLPLVVSAAVPVLGLVILGPATLGMLPTAAVAPASGLDQEGLPNGPVTYEFIQARAVSNPVYPNAQVFQAFGQGEENAFPDSGINAANLGAVFTTSESPEQVYAWYRTQLLAHGWRQGRAVPRLSVELSVEPYRRGQREFFFLAIDNPRLLSGVLGRRVPPDVTVFEARFGIDPAAWRTKPTRSS